MKVRTSPGAVVVQDRSVDSVPVSAVVPVISSRQRSSSFALVAVLLRVTVLFFAAASSP